MTDYLVENPENNSTKHLLVLDDDKMMLQLIKNKMNNQGYQTALCSNAAEAIGQLKVMRPDIILLDIILPGMNGLEFLSYIKFNQLYFDVPVIMMSVLGTQEVISAGFKLGAADYVHKPIDFGKLFLSMEKHLSAENILA